MRARAASRCVSAPNEKLSRGSARYRTHRLREAYTGLTDELVLPTPGQSDPPRAAQERAGAALSAPEARGDATGHGSVRVRRCAAAHLLSDRFDRLSSICDAGWRFGR